MNSNLKGLILTCNTGGGHNSTAEAIREQFTANGDVCDVADALEFVSEKFSNFISDWHSRIYRTVPKLFSKGYSSVEKIDSKIKGRPKSGHHAIYNGSSALRDYIKAGNYDIIICVHAFSALMVTALRRRYIPDVRACFVATDYTCSPTVADSDLDIYFIPHEALVDEFVSCGVPREKIVPSGLPVRSDFYSRTEKEEAKRLLGLPADKKNITLMGGSMGCGPIKDIAKELSPLLPEDCILTVVCGTNQKLYKSIEKYELPNVNLVGYTRDVPLLMDSSEFFMTKPGGITSTEGATKHIPMLFLDVVGGCEEKNLSFFKARGWATGTDDPAEFIAECLMLINDRKRADEMRRRLEENFSRNPAKIIYEECKNAVSGR